MKALDEEIKGQRYSDAEMKGRIDEGSGGLELRDGGVDV